MASEPWQLFRSLNSRNYRLYFFGHGLSLIGTWMTYLAASWLVYRLTSSPVLLGVVAFAGHIPAFLLAPVAGVFVDRWDRRRVLIITQALAMVQSLAMAGLIFTNQVTIDWIIGLSIAQGLINGFDLPARQAFVVDLVDRQEDLSNAIALNSSLFNGARLIGPSVAGLVIASAGEGVCFLIDGLSYLPALAAFLAMRLPRAPGRAPMRPLLHELREGARYALKSPPIMAILSLTALVSFVGFPYTVLLPVFTRDILQGGPQTLGFLMAASGLGALTGALYLASRKSVVGLGRLIVISAVLFGFSLLAFSHSRWLWLSLALMFGVGFGMLTQMGAGNTILQTVVEEDKRGRIMSFYAMAFMGMATCGSLLAGYLATHIGAPDTLIAGGICCLLGAGWFARELPKVRQITRPIYARKGRIIPQVAQGLDSANLVNPTPKSV